MTFRLQSQAAVVKDGAIIIGAVAPPAEVVRWRRVRDWLFAQRSASLVKELWASRVPSKAEVGASDRGVETASSIASAPVCETRARMSEATEVTAAGKPAATGEKADDWRGSIMKIVVIGGTGLIGSKLVWTKPADEILDKVARGQATLDRITKSATHH